MWQIIGQPRAVSLLQHGLQAGRLSHAYLIVGPPHVGKMTLALNMAQSVNCEQEFAPCIECNSCIRISANIHPDVEIIGLASEGKAEIGIGQIRDLQANAHLPPFEGKCKVFIVDGAERLSSEAANCLLKTLEEPLPRTLFVLLTARENQLLPTVVSRCQRIELRPIPHDLIREILTTSYQVPDEKAETLACLAKGCLGWAVSSAQDETTLQVRSTRIDTLIDISQANLERRLSYAAELAAEYSKSHLQVEETLTLWLGWWRDLLLVKGGSPESIVNIDYQTTLVRDSNNYELEQIAGFIHHIQDTSNKLSQNVNPRLALEVLMLSMPSMLDTLSTKDIHYTN